MRRILGRLKRGNLAAALRQWHAFVTSIKQLREMQRRALSAMSATARGKRHKMLYLAWCVGVDASFVLRWHTGLTDW